RWKPTKGRCTAIRGSRTVITISRSCARHSASPGTRSGTWRSIEGWSSREDERARNLKAILAGAALLLAISSAAIAQTATRPGWEVGGQIAHYEYLEPDRAKLSGNRGGATGAYTYADPRGLFSRIDVRESYGSLTYRGSGTKNNVPDLIFETRVVAGLDFFPSG